MHSLQLDVVDEAAVKGVAKFIEDTDGKLDILVNKYESYLGYKNTHSPTSNEQCWYQRTHPRYRQMDG